ncbi:peptidylprolyl isomerase SurA [Alteromonas gilva]|uniref:Chaperone SurA n=1 Tax=Alteromonas gilva TaxID=2987522 RepID=A0ABT5L2H0_9ALTE|nr:peptidylprolyl isomerase SurA [Alteromonas gilva]MDC8830032.1 peptidylprolyl isomerase SurA [Alteromonas gilva]
MKYFIRGLFLSLVISLPALAQMQMLDRVAVIVDQGVVLESEVRKLVSEVKAEAAANNQELPSDAALRTQAIERLILRNLQLQMADRMGIQVSDPQLDQTIANIAANEGATVPQVREELMRQGISYDDYREQIREEMIMGEVRRANVRRRIYITPQEITNLVDVIDQQGSEQAEYELGHILIGFPPDLTDEDVAEARERADRVLKLLNDGSEFARLAIAASSGSEALDGGNMGWMNINAMPSLFAEAVQGKRKGELIGPIRSGAGFHILKIIDTRGIEVVEVEEVKARHILIEPSIILSEERAKNMLLKFKEQVLADEADFAELAKEHSADPGSALRGGDLGWANPEMYVPEFKQSLATLEPGEYSDPVRTQHGWHLIQLLDRRIDDATEQRKEDKAYQLLFNRKFAEESENWLREMRDSAYIEVLSD